jgi:hypothetical protein
MRCYFEFPRKTFFIQISRTTNIQSNNVLDLLLLELHVSNILPFFVAQPTIYHYFDFDFHIQFQPFNYYCTSPFSSINTNRSKICSLGQREPRLKMIFYFTSYSTLYIIVLNKNGFMCGIQIKEG